MYEQPKAENFNPTPTLPNKINPLVPARAYEHGYNSCHIITSDKRKIQATQPEQ
jgi:hypothetical protein